MRSLLFQVPPLSVAVLAAAACVTAAVCLGACLLPSQRATQISPMEVLTEE
jgi:ABC-type lipoprotein release transport system permease subunit